MQNNSITIFDRDRLRQNRRRAETLKDFDFLSHWTQEQIATRLFEIKRSFKDTVTIDNQQATVQPGNVKIITDEEFFPFAHHSLDLVISVLTLHATNDLPGTLLQIKQALKPDGFFIGALFGGETLHELRASLLNAELELKGGASPRVFPFADKQQMGALMQRAGYALPVVDSEIVTVTYDNIFKLMHDLRGMAETNIIIDRNKKYPGREFFLRAGEYYADQFSEPDGRITATFEIIFLAGWAPHASQQQPLKPGSAKARLADALETIEFKAGEMPA